MVAQRHDGSPRGRHLIKSWGGCYRALIAAVTPACSRAFAPMEYAREYAVRVLVVTHESLIPQSRVTSMGPLTVSHLYISLSLTATVREGVVWAVA